MKTRDNISAVIEGQQRHQGLLAAYLEATRKPVMVNVEVRQASSSPFVFRRANLVPMHQRRSGKPSRKPLSSRLGKDHRGYQRPLRNQISRSASAMKCQVGISPAVAAR